MAPHDLAAAVGRVREHLVAARAFDADVATDLETFACAAAALATARRGDRA